MKVSLLTAAALASLLALSGCGAAAQSTPSGAAAVSGTASPSGMAEAQSTASAEAAPTTQAALSTEGKVHFSGDYTKTTAADSEKIIELSKQWYTPEKEAVLREKMAGTGLASNIPQEQVDLGWYVRTATACQAKFDGHKIPMEGVWVEIDKLVTSTYCPEVS